MSADESITNLPDAVAALGALPMPAGPVPQGLEARERVELLAGLERALTPFCADPKAAAAAAAGARHCEAEWLLRDAQVSQARVAELEAERHVTNEALDDAVRELRLRESGPALPWAHTMSDHDLHGFLDDMVSAAMGRWRSEPEVPDRTVLADIEKVCADWRTPGAGSRLDGSEFDGATVRLAEPEPEFYGVVHHDYRPGLGRDLPETGGAPC